MRKSDEKKSEQNAQQGEGASNAAHSRENNKMQKISILSVVRNIIAGVVVGVSNVIPGVSGGTMAVSMGVYDELMESLSSKWKEHLYFLITIAIGAVAGILVFSNLATHLVNLYPMQTSFAFMGLVIGSIPMVYKRASKAKIKPGGVIPFIIGLAVMVVMYIFSRQNIENEVLSSINGLQFIRYVLSLALAAFAMIIPGVSGSLVLVILGVYETVITGVAQLNVMLLVPSLMGGVIGLFLGVRLVRWLLEEHPQGTYMAILGLMIGSLVAIYPTDQAFALNSTGLVSVLTLVIGAAVSYLFARTDK